MSADYNLLVIGATPAAMMAAKLARAWQARVALIYAPGTWAAYDRDRLLVRCLLQSANVSEALERAQDLAERLELLEGPIALQQAGIDVIAGHWQAQSQAGKIQCGDRQVTTRHILHTQPTGAETTLLWDYLRTHPTPRSLTMAGDRALAVSAAQALQRQGWSIRLATPAVWANWEPVIIQRLQAQLQAEGVELLAGVPSKDNSGLRFVQPDPLPLLPGSRSIAGDAPPVVVRAIVQHCLFGWPKQRPSAVPQQILELEPKAAQVGLTEMQARRHYGKDLRVLTTSWQQQPEALLRDRTAGFLQLYLHRNGQILGASLVTTDADALVAPLSLAIQEQRSPLSLLGIWPRESPGHIVEQLIIDWQQLQGQQGWKQRLLDEWHIFWRSTF